MKKRILSFCFVFCVIVSAIYIPSYADESTGIISCEEESLYNESLFDNYLVEQSTEDNVEYVIDEFDATCDSIIDEVESDGAGNIVYSDTYGNNIKWTLTDDGVLTLTGNGEMYDKSEICYGFSQDEKIDSLVKSIVIKKGITTVGTYAFSQLTNLEKVFLPDGISVIKDGAFSKCKKLRSINIPATVEGIGEYAFLECEGLCDVTLPLGLKRIGQNAFSNCLSITSISIPVGVKEIPYGSFSRCTNLSSLNLPEGLEHIGYHSFSYCSTLKSVVIPNSVTKIDTFAFAYCDVLDNITLPRNASGALSAFHYCKSLKSITVPGCFDSVCMLDYCLSLKDVVLESGVKSISSNTFSYNPELKSISIPKTVNFIGYAAFSESTNLSDVYYEGTATDFSNIVIEDMNECLLNASIHYSVYPEYKEVEKEKYVVVFNPNGGTPEYSANVLDGERIAVPADPHRTGYILSGWYTEASCENPFDFSSPVNSNMTLYAKWIVDNGETVSEETDAENEQTAGVYTFSIKYGQTDARKMSNMVNDFRTGTDAWAWNYDNTEKEYYNDLEPFIYDYGLEQVAMQRAGEIALLYSHTRPDGSSCFSAYPGMKGAKGENIALGYKTAGDVFKAWQETKEKYDGQGHRRNMLSDDTKYIGIGHAIVNGTHLWVQEFCSKPINTDETEVTDKSIDIDILVSPDYAEGATFSLDVNSLMIGINETKELPKASGKITTYSGCCYSIGKMTFKAAALNWSAKDKGIVYINDGYITGIESGKTTLTAYAGKWSKQIPIEVVVVPEEIEIDKEIMLKQGDQCVLTTKVLPENASDKTVFFRSSDSTVVAVDNNGTLTAIGGGTAIITAYSKIAERVSTECEVTVTESVCSISMKKTLVLREGESDLLSAVVNRRSATNKSISWTSSDENIVSIKRIDEETSTITVEGIQTGEVDIIAKAVDESKVFAVCKIFVVKEKSDGFYVEYPEGDEYVYTGEKIIPAVNVYYKSQKLDRGIDYDITFTNNTAAGVAKVTVKGRNGFKGTCLSSFRILPKSIAEDNRDGGTLPVIAFDSEKIVAGENYTPTMTYRGVLLGKKDYIIQGKNKITTDMDVIIYGKGNYTGERHIRVSAKQKAEIKRFTASIDKEMLVYDGTEKYPSGIHVRDVSSKTSLVEGEDYEIRYPVDVISVGKKGIVIIGKNNYTGTKKLTYEINPLKADASVSISETEYDPDGGIPKHEVSIGGIRLIDGEDYKITFSENKKAGKGKYTIKFLGNYTTTPKKTGAFVINKRSLSNSEVITGNLAYSTPGLYASKPFVLDESCLVSAKEYSVEYYDAKGNKVDSKNKVTLEDGKIETIFVRITGKGNYEGVVWGKYKVQRADAKINLGVSKIISPSQKSILTQTYSGEFVKPNVIVTYGSGKNLNILDHSQYEICYLGNVKPGNGVVIANAKDDSQYVGSKVETYKIIPVIVTH